MDVFISWSGKRSGIAAQALHDWLPKIINALKPWLSAADIDKGARWGTEIAEKLKDSKAGIICLTAENLHSDWLIFEAGALSKTIENTFVCPFLIGLEPADVKPPLAQFQATRATKNEVLTLLKTLNKALGEHALQIAHIEEAFEVWWPRLETTLKRLPSDGDPPKATRSDRELLEEILALVRSQGRQASTQAAALSQISADKVRTQFQMELQDVVSAVEPGAVVEAIVAKGSRYMVEIRIDDRIRRIFIPRETRPVASKEAIVQQLRSDVDSDDVS